MYLIKKRKFRGAYNYFWARIFSIEEGLGISTPLYRYNPNLAPYPRRIELEVTTKCSLRCPKCEHTYWCIQEKDMSFEQFKRVIEQFPRLRAISLSGIGHGFQNKDYLKMLRYLKAKSIFVQFFDPLLLVDERIAKELIEIGVDWIWMSIDGATKETYERLMVGSNFERVINSARNLVRLKREIGSAFPELHFQPIITKYNVHEMPKLVELAHSIIGQDQPFCKVQFIQLIPFRENEYLMPEITDEILEATRDRAKELGNLKVEFVHMRKGAKRLINQCVAWTVPFITVDGTVYPCCTLTEGNIRHLVKEYALGNIFQKHYREIWYSQEFKNFRQMVHQGEAPLLCNKFRNCTLFDTSTGCSGKFG
jgi:radical SAM protein with 4Fe4S-binding SPASM domain